MPHDKNGTLLTVGDRVTMEFEVKQIGTNEDHCNCMLESVIPLHPGSPSTGLSAVNTKQLVKIG